MMRMRRLAPHLRWLALYAIFTLALTWPISVHPASLVAHDLGDPLLSTWVLWWNAQVLPFTERWWNGLAFFPAPSSLTFSDHRVGLSLIATPAILLGAPPQAVHNLILVISFFLCAAAAYALCFELTHNRHASFIAGLIFGFNPYRADHLSHLELLASYWLPVVLLSLHRWLKTRKRAWLGAVSAALLMQALTSGYYFFFFGVLLLLWVVWFTPRDVSKREFIQLAAALAAPLLAIAPILLEYRHAHQALGLFRSINDIEYFSADLIGLITAPEPLFLWNSPKEWLHPEGAIMPGVTAVLLVLTGAMLSRYRGDPESPPYAIARRVLMIASLAAVMVSLIPAVAGPLRYDIGGIHLSTSRSDKPLSIAVLFALVWCLTSPRVRHAWRTHAPFAFYALITPVMWAFALGPTARLLGHRVLYKAPYAWLMVLPGFRDEFRAPARFAMLATLTLSVAAALALQKALAHRRARVSFAATAIIASAIAIESWIAPFPVVPLPPSLTVPATVPGDAVIAELPMGAFEDAIAMYHSMSHERPIVNGLSGYEPPHYPILRGALEEGSFEALLPLAASRDLALFLPRQLAGDLRRQVSARTGAQLIAASDTHDVLLLPRLRSPQDPSPLEGTPLRIVALNSALDPSALPHMLDGNMTTVWSTNGPQTGGESFTADLGRVARVSGVVLQGGTAVFPRKIAIELSIDGTSWSEVWRDATAAKSVAAAIDQPRVVPLALGFAAQSARYVRVTQIGQSRYAWFVAELRVLGSGNNERR